MSPFLVQVTEEEAQRLNAAVDGGRALVLLMDEVAAEGSQVDGAGLEERDVGSFVDPGEPVPEELHVVEVGLDGRRREIALVEGTAEGAQELFVAGEMGCLYYTHNARALSTGTLRM